MTEFADDDITLGGVFPADMAAQWHKEQAALQPTWRQRLADRAVTVFAIVLSLAIFAVIALTVLRYFGLI